MERSVVIFGALSFPAPSDVEAWKQLGADPSAHRDWKGELKHAQPDARTVAALLARFEAFPRDKYPPGRVDVRVSSAAVTVRGYLDDDGTRDWGPLVLSALRAAAATGAKGRVLAVQPQGSFGFALEIGDGASRLSKLPTKGLEDLLETPEGAEAVALLGERLPKIDKAALEAVVAQRAPVAQAAAAYEGLVAAIAKAPAPRVLGAVKELEDAGVGLITLDPKTGRPTSEVTGRRDLRRLSELWPTADALLAGLREGGNVDVRATAVRLAALVAPDGAEAIAALLAAKPDAGVVKVAAQELTRAKHPRVTRLLLDLARDPPAGPQAPATATAAAVAAATAGGTSAVKELLSLLTPELVESADRADLALAIIDVAQAARASFEPERTVDLWVRAVSPHVRDRLYRAIATSNDRELLAQAIAHAKTDAERRDLETARRRAKPAKKPAAKKTAPAKARSAKR